MLKFDLYWFAYSAPPDVMRGRRTEAAQIGKALHMERNGAAFAFVHGRIARKCCFRDVIMNFPAEAFDEPVQPEPVLSEHSLLVLTSRPPLDDEEEFDRKYIARSGTQLESDVIAALRRVLSYCSRSEVMLNPELLDAYHDVPTDRRYHRFRKYSPCTMVRYGESDEHNNPILPEWENLTLGFLLYLPKIYDNGGPALLTCFGMSGPATLVWSAIMDNCVNLESLIIARQRRLIVAQFHAPPVNHPLPASIAQTANDLANIELVIDLTW